MNLKYVIDTNENKQFLNEMQDELLRFGVNFPAPSGGSYYLWDNGEPCTDRPIEAWITCRMAHVYSIGHMMGVDGADKLAEKAIEGLVGPLKDKTNGGWYQGITSDGGILETKQCYAHAFVILAGTSGKLAGIKGADELLGDALETFDKYFWDDEAGLTMDTYNTEFTHCDSYRGLNANMHTVEAFLAVADALGEESYRNRAGRIIDRVVEWARDNSWRIPEHFTSDWQPDLDMNISKPDDPFKPYGATCGHGIEWARLILQWAVSSKADSKYIEISEKLYNQAITDGWNVDGAPGIVYTTDWEGKPVVQDRMHWTLAEAINTSAVLYRATGKKKYAEDYGEFMKYLDEVVHDKIHGSWFHQLDERNNLKNTVWPGKSDLYHAFQAMTIPYGKIDKSIAVFVKEEEKDR